MSHNDRSSSQGFLPHAIQTFLWGRTAQHPNDDVTDGQPGQLRAYVRYSRPLINTLTLFGNNTGPAASNPMETVPPPTHAPTHDDSDAHSDSSMPDLLSDGWSDSDSSQDARDVEMDIIPDDDDANWVDEDEEMPPLHPTVPVEQVPATNRRARVDDEVEPQPLQQDRAPNPAPPPRLHTGTGTTQPFPTMPPWNFGLGTTRPPGRLFPLFPNPAVSSGSGNNASPDRDHTAIDPHPQPTQPPQPDQNPTPGNAQQDTRGPRFHAHTFVLGMDGSGRAVPLPPGAFSNIFNPFGGPGAPQPQTRTAQHGQPQDQTDENPDQPRQPGDPGLPQTLFDFVVGGVGPLPPFFTAPFGPGQQPPTDGPVNGGGAEPGGAPGWADLLRAMLGGEPPEEKEDPERAKKLVKGLEHVPEGLVKRMIRVDGIPGAHEDLAEAEGDKVPGCAICWDGLLPEEPSEGTGLHPGSFTPPTPEGPVEGSDPKPAASDPTPDDESPTAIICLPCSHVFHASCLVPWFSKPKHTTCPTCRFDIDPKNLTYTPPRQRPPPATTTANATPPNDTQSQTVPNSTTATANPASPSTTQDHEHPPPLEPVSDDEGDDEDDLDPDFLTEAPAFIPNVDFLAAQPQRTFFDMFRGPITPQAQDHTNGDREQQGHDRLPGEVQGDIPNDGHDIPPLNFGFGFGLQQPPVFGPPPPPEHPTHGAGAATADPTHDHDHGPHTEQFPDFGRGGVGHAHFHGEGIAVDFTLHVPPEHGMDPERISQAVRDQAAAFLRFFAGGGRGPGMGQPTGPASTPGAGDANHEPEAPREWMPPPAPGPTLRQRVEAKEHQAGLRCHDPSCGIGPSDEDPFPEVFNNHDSASIKRVGILKDGGEDVACGHIFHPGCLVSADRCAGWGEGDRNDGIEELKVVSCPVCRSVGKVQREVWEEGEKALLV